MSNKTKEEIAETFIFNQTEVGWFRDKYDNFLAGYDSRNSEIETLNARILKLEVQIESLTNIAVMEVSCKGDKIELNDETVDSFINNYVKHLPDNWRTTLDMYLAMKNAMLESLSCPNKYLTPKNP